MKPSRSSHPLLRALSLLLALQFALPPSLPFSVLAEEAINRIEVNQGDQSRSRVTNLIFHSPTNRTLAPHGFRLQSLAAGSPVVTNWLLSLNSRSNLATVAFSNDPGGALPDGNYLASFITESVTNVGAANTPWESVSLPFHQLFGDVDGDRDVDFLDTFFFRQTLAESFGNGPFDPRFDLDGDGRVTSLELSAYKENYFTVLAPQPSIFAHLIYDDGASPVNGVTTDPTISGRVFRTNTSAQVRAGLQVIAAPPAPPDEPLPVDLTPELNPDGTFQLSTNRLIEILGAPLGVASYQLRLQIVETNGLVSAWFGLPFTISGTNCHWQSLDDWRIEVSPVMQSSAHPITKAGSVSIDHCAALIREGDSFRVSMKHSLVVPNERKILAVSYGNLSFDATSTNRIKDAFEISVLDSENNPLTYTIDSSSGGTPVRPQRDACFNATEGVSLLLAPGVAHASSTVFIDLTHLEAGTTCWLVMRLVNNDLDRDSSVAIETVKMLGQLPEGVAFERPQSLTTLGTSNKTTRNAAAPKLSATHLSEQVQSPNMISLPTLRGVQGIAATAEPSFPVASRLTVHSNYIAEVFASNIPGVCALAFPPVGSAYYPNLYASTDPTPVASCSGQNSRIYSFGLDGKRTLLATLPLESSPWSLAFPPIGSVYGDLLYVSANDWANDPCAFFDGGGTIMSVFAAGGWTNFSGVGTAGGGPKNPWNIDFGFGTAFGDQLFAATTSDEGTIAALRVINPNGIKEAFLTLDTSTTHSRVGRGPWKDRLLIQANSHIVGIRPDKTLEPLLDTTGYGYSMQTVANPAFGTNVFLTMVGNSDRSIIRISPDNRSETFATGFGPASGEYYSNVSLDSIEFSSDGRFLFLSDWVSGTIYRFRPKAEPAALSLSFAASPSALPAGSELVLSGAVGYTGGSEGRGKSIAVLINGIPVQALDPEGTFYTRVYIKSGENRFEIAASDELGQSATASIMVSGTELSAASDLRSLASVSASVVQEYGRTSFNDWTKVLYAELALRNAGTYAIRAPFYVGVTRISDPSVKLLAPNVLDADGIPYYDYSDALTSGALDPGFSSLPRALAFHNPNKVQFTYDIVVLGQLNQGPAFTTTPALEGIAGKPYTYAFNATDPDGDILTYSLATGPAGLTLNPQLQTLNWSPLATNLGTHNIRLIAHDGKGGIAEQHYLLSVINLPSNRPPYFVSMPITVARVAPKGSALECLPLPKGAVAWWPGDGTANDVINANHGIQQNGLSTTISGYVRQAFAFDGIDDYVAIPSSSNLAVQTFTITGWIFSTDLNESRPIFEWAAEDGFAGVHVWQSTREGGAAVLTGAVQVNLRDDRNLGLASSHELATPSDVLQSHQWNHIAVSYDKPKGIATIVINGIKQAEKNVGNSFNLKTSVPLSFGRRPENSFDGSAGVHFKGLIDEVLLFNRALSVEEIAGIHAIGTVGLCQPNISPALSSYQYSSAAIDPDGDPLTYSLLIAPTNMTIDPETGIIRWGPTAADIGTHNVTVQAADGRGGIASQFYHICVLADGGNRPPIITSFPLTNYVLPHAFATGNSITLNMTVRDFTDDHPDFERCVGGVNLGIVQPILGSDRTPLYAPAVSYGCVTSSSTFSQWYHDVPGVNQSLVLPLVLSESSPGSGIYTYENGSFFPINDLLFGNQGRSQNYHFTADLHTTFTYRGGEVFSFEGDDDIWVFLNNQLVIDLGGIHAAASASVNLDSLGLVTGQSYPFDLFFAERHTSQSNFRLTTSVEFMPDRQYLTRITGMDPDGDILSYQLIAGPVGMTLNYTNGLISWNPGAAQRGDHVIKVRVTDGRGGATEQFFVVNVTLPGSSEISGTVFSDINGSGVHEPGVENALADWTVFIDQNRNGHQDNGELASTSGGSGLFRLRTLPDGQYRVQIEPKVGWVSTLPMSGFAEVSLTNGQFSLNLDFGLQQQTNSGVNTGPVFVSQPTTNLVPATGTFIYQSFVRDAEGDLLAFDLVTHPEGMVVKTNSGVVAWRPLLGQLGTHDVILRVQDGRGGVALQSWQITVTAPNSPPFIASFPPGPAVVGQPYRYTILAQDPESQPLTFTLATNAPTGLTLTSGSSNSALLSWTPALAQLGTNPVEIIVRDSQGAESLQSFGLEVVVSAPNSPPTITSTPRTQTRVGSPYAYVIEVRDPDGDPVTVNLLSGPSGMVVTNLPVADGVESVPAIYWPGAELGSYTIQLRASDGRNGTAEQQFTLNVASSLNNQPPLITSLPLEHATAGQAYDYQLRAIDADGDAVTWHVLTGPVGMSLDPATGRLLWIPTLDQMGTNSVIIVATDSLLASATQTFSIDVGCLNRPPQITSVPPTAAHTGDPYLYAPRGNDPDGDRLTWSLVPGQFPPGMTVNITNGLVRWTPTTNQAGAIIVSVQVSDGRGGNDTQTFTLYAVNLRANHAPIIVTSPPRGATVDRPYFYNLSAIDSDGDSLTLQSLVALPAGASFTPSIDGQGVLSWTPQPNQQGQQEFILAARDSTGASASQRFFVTVRSNQAPVITSIARNNAVPSVTYRYDVSAFDPDGDALTYGLVTPVPSGLVIDNLGRVSWTPSYAQTGVFPIAVTASDSFGASTTQAFKLFVTEDTEPPQVSLTVGSNLNDEVGNRFVKIGTEVPVRVQVSDNVGVASRELRVAGQVIPLSASGGASVLFPTSGPIPAIAQATDLTGNVTFTTNMVQVVDPNAASTVAIVIHSPTNTTEVKRSVPVIATVTSQVPLFAYQVEFAPIESDIPTMEMSMDDPSLDFQTITNVTLPLNTFGLTNITVGHFDPLMLLNGAYAIRVSAFDQNRQGQREGVIVNVAGNLKFGEFRLEFTDLTIPVAGIPITVKRVYDTRDSRRQGDFGYGWSLGVQDARILEIGKRPFYGFDDEGTTFTTRTRVYMSTPDGRRVGFNFTPQFAGGSFIFGAYFRPAFTADPGVYDRLEAVPADAGYQIENDGSVSTGFGLVGLDPATYRLTTRDNLVYDYDQRGGLQRVSDPIGNRLLYTRDGVFHYSAGATDADQSIRLVRDAQGRITQIIDPTGNILRYTYDASGNLRAFADPVTNVTQYAYSQARAHFLTNIVDFLGRSALRAEFDASGALTALYDANGTPLRQAFNVNERTATFTDGNGTVTLTAYDERGNETLRAVQGIYTNRFEFDANNNLLRSVNGRGYSTNYTYDTRGNVTSITDSLSNHTTIAYNEFSKPTRVVNPLGQTLALTYNTSGQLTQVVNNAGFKTAVTRDAQGRVASLTDAAGNTTQFNYEGGCACGRPGKVINPDGSFRLYGYNSLGQTNRFVNELGAEFLSEFDDSGRLLSTHDPLGNTTRYFYSGQLLTNVVDALGRSTRYEYDALNRTNAIIDAEGGIVRFEYDRRGNRTKVIDAVSNVTTFVYDPGNRLIQQIDPLGQTNFFGFDAAGNRTEAIDRNGRKRTFLYDAANRMTNELWWEGTNVVRSIVFAFNELGVQTLAADPAARYEYSYDALNRLERVLSQSAGVPDFTLLYTYTALGQVASVTDHWGVRVGSGYDNRSRLASRTWSSTLPGAAVDPARVDFAYDASGNRVRTDRFADLAGANRIGYTTNAYNRAGVVTNITHLGAVNEVLARYDYSFDSAYQITKWSINNQPSILSYDSTGQLTNALNTAQPNENFRFDANGNRVGAQSGGSYVVSGNNQILSDGTNSYAYDAEGNMTSRSNTVTGVLTTYQFDHRNRLVSVLDLNPGGVVTQTVTFIYDAMNRRLSKTVNVQQNTNVVRFLYDQDDSWADLDGADAVTARYLHGARVDELLARQRAGDGRGWYLSDHLATVRDLANAAGAIIAHVDYSSFGQVLGVSDPAAVDRFLFTGRELDGETGLYFYRARYYSPRLGVFVSTDPIGFGADGFNLYRYVRNAPVIATDPTGQQFLEYLVRAAYIGAAYGTIKYSLCALIYGTPFTLQGLGEAQISGAKFGVIFYIIFVLWEAGAWVGPAGPYPGPPPPPVWNFFKFLSIEAALAGCWYKTS